MPRASSRSCSRLAGIAATFTPQVSIESPDGLLLEIKPSIALFGGLRQLCRQLRAACLADPMFAASGCAPHFTLAPTALAALVAARAGARCFITDPHQLPARLKPLPLSALRWPEEENERLRGHGRAHARRAPAPAARRVRPTFRHHDGLPISTGCSAVAPIRADASRGASVTRAASISITKSRITSASSRRLRPLLDELEQFLRTRQRGITALQCRFHHYRARTHVVRAAAGAPGSECRAAASLLRERLANLSLPEPVRRCELRGGALTRAAAREPAAVVAGRARSCAGGRDARAHRTSARASRRVRGVWPATASLSTGPRMRWRVAEPALDAVVSAATPWSPRCAARCGCSRAAASSRFASAAVRLRGALELLAGPERIESGWWDGADVQRDYYVARDMRGAHRLDLPRVRGAAALVPARSLRVSAEAPPPLTPSCIASATSASCAAPRTRRSWWCRRRSSVTARSPSPTNVRSRAWCARTRR